MGVAVSPVGQAPYTDVNVGYFHGRIDDVRIYDRSLSCEEIQELHSGTSIPGDVPGERWVDKVTLEWGVVSCTTEYHIYRGPLTGLSSGDYGSCLDAIDPDRTDTTLLDTTFPDLGKGLFYLITAENSLGQEGTLGYASSGERPNLSPCP